MAAIWKYHIGVGYNRVAPTEWRLFIGDKAELIAELKAELVAQHPTRSSFDNWSQFWMDLVYSNSNSAWIPCGRDPIKGEIAIHVIRFLQEE